MKMLVGGLATLALLAGEHWAQAVTTTLDMGQDPTALGWRVVNSGGSHSVSNGILTIDAPSYYELDAPPPLWEDAVDNDAGWSIETRTRLISFVEDSSSIGGLALWIHAIGNYANLSIFPDKIRLSHPAFVEHSMSTMDDFHVYRVEGRGDRVRVHADDALVIDVTGSVTSGTRTLYFGDGSSANPTTSQWDYFTVTHYARGSHWVGRSGGEWDRPEHWYFADAPTHDDDVSIQPDIGLTVIGSQTVQTIRSLTVGAQTLGTTTLRMQNTGTLNVLERTTMTGSGRLAGEGILNAGGGFDNHGEIDLGSGGLQLVGGPLVNYGTIRGHGRIDNTLENEGDIWAHSGESLVFTGSGSTNSGDINLVGGSVGFELDLMNASDGFISGRGVLTVGSQLTNDGTMAFAGGFTDVHGDVINDGPDSRIVVSGGSTTVFYDDVHSDGQMSIGTGSSAVFFGGFSGTGGTTGPGTAHIHGDLRPGQSPGEVSFDGNVVLGPRALLEIEIGGGEAGSQYDVLDVGGIVTLGGTLEVSLIDGFVPNRGETFEVITFRSALGDFAEYRGLVIDGELRLAPRLTSGRLALVTVPEPSTQAILAMALVPIAGWARRRRWIECTAPKPRASRPGR